MSRLRHCLRHGDYLAEQAGDRCPWCPPRERFGKMRAIVRWLATQGRATS